VLSANMLDENEYKYYVEENVMILNPVERYIDKKSRKEGMEKGMRNGKLDDAKKMVAEGFSIDVIVRITGLSEEDILNIK